jgi:hypothetical protein
VIECVTALLSARVEPAGTQAAFAETVLVHPAGRQAPRRRHQEGGASSVAHAVDAAFRFAYAYAIIVNAGAAGGLARVLCESMR